MRHLALLLTAVLLAGAEPHKEERLLETSQWMRRTEGAAPVRWDPDKLPLLVVVHTMAADWHPDIEEAARAWNRAVGCTLFVVMGPTNIVPERRALTSGVVPVYLDAEGRTYTKFWADRVTGEMDSAWVFMGRGTYPQGYTAPAAAHELGHVLGLGHDAEPESVMHGVLDPARPPPNLAPDDVRRLRAWYCR